MTPYFGQSGIEIYQGNSVDVMRELSTESVHCVVTSPPYWGLRDYGTGEWEGGDYECEHSCGGQVQDSKAPGAITTGVRPGCDTSVCRKCGATRLDEQIGLEKTPEEYISRLVELFREVRRVLRSDGTCWINIGDSYASSSTGSDSTTSTLEGAKDTQIEGGRNRPNKIVGNLKPKDLVGIPWMLAFALRQDGWWLRQDIIWSKPNPMPESVADRCTKAHEYIFLLSKSARYYYNSDAIKEKVAQNTITRLNQDVENQKGSTRVPYKTNGTMRAVGGNVFRNKRSVWEIATKGYSEAHFATYPTDLVKPCILAGCPSGGTVLDPFSGSGTTGLVARENGCKYIGIELNPEYIDISAKRLEQDVLQFS